MISTANTLYIVATPIGNRGDISARALDVLQQSQRIYAEDTRHSKPLLQHYGIDTPLLSLHEHNEQMRAQQIVDFVQNQGSVAIISDAGTPLISDPGYRIVRSCQEAGLPVSPIPGASALTAALSVSGLPTDSFLFVGFGPAKQAGRRALLKTFESVSYTVVMYESVHRIMALLDDIIAELGGSREVCVARELTKKFETIERGSVELVRDKLQMNPQQQKGEFVLLIAGVSDLPVQDDAADALINTTVHELLVSLLAHVPLKLAAKIVSDLSGVPRKQVYNLGVSIDRQ